MTLSEIRILIDELDPRICDLLMQRMDYSAMVADAKLAEGETTIYRADREEALLRRLGERVPEERLPEYISVVKKIMEASRMYQYGLIYDRLENPFGPLIGKMAIPADCRLVTITLTRPDRPNAMSAILSMIGDYGFDMEQMERTDMDPNGGSVTFRLQIRGNLHETRMKKLMFQLSKESEHFRILACGGSESEPGVQRQ